MPRYSAKATITITRTYQVILETDVDNAPSVVQEPKVAFDQIRHFALGMKQADLDALERTREQAGCYEGEETTVVDVWDVREEEEDEEEVILQREAQLEAEDHAWGEWAAHDPEAAERAATDVALLNDADEEEE